MKKIIEAINKSKNVAIFTHTRPDPDAIGSVVAMQQALKQLNKNSTVFLEEELDLRLDFINFENVSFDFPKTEDFDLAIVLDVANPSLLNKFENQFKKFEKSICIDHHIMREQISKYDFVQTSVSSTTEILYDLFSEMNLKITPVIASCLYLGIVGDTGRFLHNNTTAKTLKIASSLIQNGANINHINKKLFLRKTKELILGTKILFNNLDFKKNILFSHLSLADYKNEKINPASSSQLIGFLNGIENIDIVVVLNEKSKNEINISLRSTENFDVSLIAKHFGGGGHKQASGFQNIKGDILQIKETVYKYIKENLNEIKIK